MLIGELATLVGVSTRTVRHYHHVGLLPEPQRSANGYREYRLRDAVLLARVRRLTEVGLSLDEIRDVLADDAGQDLREMLRDLDADLARREADLAARRVRLRALLAEPDLDADTVVSPELRALLATLPGPASPSAAVDRDLLTLIDGIADDADRGRLAGLLADLAGPVGGGDPIDAGGHPGEGGPAWAATWYARLDEVADASPGDPRTARLAEDLVAALPAELRALAATQATAAAAGTGSGGPADWTALLATELTPGQVAVFQEVLARLADPADGAEGDR